jgi:hypothetical protein
MKPPRKPNGAKYRNPQTAFAQGMNNDMDEQFRNAMRGDMLDSETRKGMKMIDNAGTGLGRATDDESSVKRDL